MAGREGGEGMPPSGWDVSQLSVGDRIGKDTFLRVSYYTGLPKMFGLHFRLLLLLLVVVSWVFILDLVVGSYRRCRCWCCC